MKKLIKTLSILMMIGGFIFLLGTAGASDYNNIAISQIIIQSLAAFGIMGLGFTINCYIGGNI